MTEAARGSCASEWHCCRAGRAWPTCAGGQGLPRFTPAATQEAPFSPGGQLQREGKEWGARVAECGASAWAPPSPRPPRLVLGRGWPRRQCYCKPCTLAQGPPARSGPRCCPPCCRALERGSGPRGPALPPDCSPRLPTVFRKHLSLTALKWGSQFLLPPPNSTLAGCHWPSRPVAPRVTHPGSHPLPRPTRVAPPRGLPGQRARTCAHGPAPGRPAGPGSGPSLLAPPAPPGGWRKQRPPPAGPPRPLPQSRRVCTAPAGAGAGAAGAPGTGGGGGPAREHAPPARGGLCVHRAVCAA